MLFGCVKVSGELGFWKHPERVVFDTTKKGGLDIVGKKKLLLSVYLKTMI